VLLYVGRKKLHFGARQHNDANIISIPARFTSIPQVLEMVEAFLLLLILKVEDIKIVSIK
jgi:hypothetical protein